MKRERQDQFWRWCGAGVLFAAFVSGCANKAAVDAPLEPGGPALSSAPSSAMVFESPFVRARHAEHGALPLEDRPEYDRRASTLSARAVHPVLGARQWPEPARPSEGRVPVIWSRWGRSF